MLILPTAGPSCRDRVADEDDRSPCVDGGQPGITRAAAGDADALSGDRRHRG